jgi:hypothetical protein
VRPPAPGTAAPPYGAKFSIVFGAYSQVDRDRVPMETFHAGWEHRRRFDQGRHPRPTR